MPPCRPHGAARTSGGLDHREKARRVDARAEGAEAERKYFAEMLDTLAKQHKTDEDQTSEIRAKLHAKIQAAHETGPEP